MPFGAMNAAFLRYMLVRAADSDCLLRSPFKLFGLSNGRPAKSDETGLDLTIDSIVPLSCMRQFSIENNNNQESRYGTFFRTESHKEQ